jgi:hypothetical protein
MLQPTAPLDALIRYQTAREATARAVLARAAVIELNQRADRLRTELAQTLAELQRGRITPSEAATRTAEIAAELDAVAVAAAARADDAKLPAEAPHTWPQSARALTYFLDSLLANQAFTGINPPKPGRIWSCDWAADAEHLHIAGE